MATTGKFMYHKKQIWKIPTVSLGSSPRTSFLKTIFPLIIPLLILLIFYPAHAFNHKYCFSVYSIIMIFFVLHIAKLNMFFLFIPRIIQSPLFPIFSKSF